MTTVGATDPRGVLRGGCTSCTCPRYSRPTQSDIKCFACGHPPGRHLKLDPVSSPVGHGGYHSGAQSVSSTYAGAASRANPNQYSYQQPQPPSGQSACSGGSQPYSAYSSPPIDLPLCPALSCFKKVHYDFELGPFDYCSPECRNQDLLPRERERLTKDIADFTTKISSLPPLDNPASSAAAHGTSGDSKPGKFLVVKFQKKPKEEIGIVTMDEPGEGGLRILGVELYSPAYKALKEGDIKFFDVITELNEERVTMGVLFRQNTRDKTRPELTLKRNRNTPSIKTLLTKVKDKCPSATHIRVLKSPWQIDGETDFGFEPVTVIDQHQGTQFKLGVRPSSFSSAHLSGVTTDDIVLMYALMNSGKIGEGKIPLFKSTFEEDIRTAVTEGKSLILVLKRQYI